MFGLSLTAANPAKFQFMISEKSSSQTDDCSAISSKSQAKLFGIYHDNFRNFSYHVTPLLHKASRELRCLKCATYPLKSDPRLLFYK